MTAALQSQSTQKSTVYAIRQGTLMLSLDCHQTLTETVVGNVCDAVKADSRVHDFTRPAYRPHMAKTVTMYPYLEDVSGDEALRGLDHFHAAEMSDPLIFRLSVAPDNQPEFDGVRDFPAGDYYVAWDGTTLVVLWEQEANKKISRSAGRIVFDILAEACQRAGYATYAQACDPSCENRFSHKNVILAVEGTPNLVSSYLGAEVVTRKSLPPKPVDALRKWFLNVRFPFSLFAQYKNHAQRIRDLERLASQRLGLLLDREQQLATNRSLGRWSRWRANKSVRKNTPQPRKLLGDIWLAIANIEVSRRSWDEVRNYFKKTVEKDGHDKLFERDANDETAVDSLDLGLARASLDHFASRSDTRMMVLVTALAGAAGLAGAILGALLGAAIAS